MSGQTPGPPAHFIVVVPGYMGSKLRQQTSDDLVWIDPPALFGNLLRIPQRIDWLLAQMAYPNDELIPDGIVDQILFMPPLWKQEHYGRLLDALQGMGYDTSAQESLGAPAQKPAVYTFYYDWRQDNRISARQLGAAIQRWSARHPGAKAWVIAHSNGGIVARWYIEKEGGKEHVGRLFLMGSPWDGAPKILHVLTSGLDVFLLRLLDRWDIRSRFRELILSFPSFYQLIPYQNPFLRDENNQSLDPFADLRWLQNPQHKQMALDGLHFNQELGLTLSVPAYCFFGVKHPTTTAGIVRLGPGGDWQEIQWLKTGAGDGTVPERSAIHPQALERLPYSVGHGDIYVAQDVLEKLEYELVRKFYGGVLATAASDTLQVQFEPEGDVFAPGETIRVWALAQNRPGLTPLFGAQIDARLEWRAPLPGFQDIAPLDLPLVRLKPSAAAAGRYEGELAAPQTQGYYRLLASVHVAGQPDLELEELILVEAEGGQDQTGAGGDPGGEGREPGEPGGGGEGGEPGEPAADPGVQGGEPGDTPPADPAPLPGAPTQPGTAPTAGDSPDWLADLTSADLSGWIGVDDAVASAEDGVEPHFEELVSASPGGELPATSGAEPPAWDEPLTADPGALPPAPQAAPAAPAQFIHHTIYDQRTEARQEAPLKLDRTYMLALDVDIQQRQADAQRLEPQAFLPGESEIELSVLLASRDFSVYTTQPQQLRLPLGKPSYNKARFDFAPRHSGPGELQAYLFKDNNFIQGLSLTVNVETGAAAVTQVSKLGRSLESSAALGERDVSLVITNRDAASFDLLLVGAVAGAATVRLTLQELDAMINTARQELLQIVYLWEDNGAIHEYPPDQPVDAYVLPRLAYQTGVDISPAMHQEALRRLAKAGYRLFQGLFFAGNDPTTARLGQTLRTLARQERLKIQVVSDQFMLPWGILYMADRYDPNAIDPELFLGFKHSIEHIPLQQQMLVLNQRIPTQAGLQVSLNLNHDLDQQFGLPVAHDQQTYWQNLVQGGRVKTTAHSSKDQFLQSLADPANQDQLIYFFGHAESAPGNARGSTLSLADDEQITLDDLELSAPAFQPLAGGPLVFINACESAKISPLFYPGFLKYFTTRGARGLIGTECKIPFRFADQFSYRFFNRFLTGRVSLGQVMLELRQEFFYRHNNVLGLLYALYADGDTRLWPGISA